MERSDHTSTPRDSSTARPAGCANLQIMVLGALATELTTGAVQRSTGGGSGWPQVSLVDSATAGRTRHRAGRHRRCTPRCRPPARETGLGHRPPRMLLRRDATNARRTLDQYGPPAVERRRSPPASAGRSWRATARPDAATCKMRNVVERHCKPAKQWHGLATPTTSSRLPTALPSCSADRMGARVVAITYQSEPAATNARTRMRRQPRQRVVGPCRSLGATASALRPAVWTRIRASRGPHQVPATRRLSALPSSRQRAPARQRGSSPLSCRHCRLKVVAHQPAMLTRASLHKTGDTPLADLQSLGWFVHVFRRSGGDPQSKPFVASGCEEISRRTAGCSRPTAGPATGSVQGRPTSTTGCRCRRSVQALSRGYPRLRGPRRRG